ncbi:hypothetical protein HD554DRAFT_1200023 [Boletus coccyginus]|nr:hypothetical protein HD554DRAFT_1200023 [Boletus coccyginus]
MGVAGTEDECWRGTASRVLSACSIASLQRDRQTGHNESADANIFFAACIQQTTSQDTTSTLPLVLCQKRHQSDSVQGLNARIAKVYHRAAPIKRTAVEKQVDVRIIFLFGFLLALSVRSTIGARINTWYLFQSNTSQGRDNLTFIILYNNLIPIVTVEVVNFQQAALISPDLNLYYARTDAPALCRTSSLVEELGQIEFILSDKTWTLSRNEVEFSASIGGVVYAEEVDESPMAGAERDEEGVKDSWRTFDDRQQVLDGTSTSGKAPKTHFWPRRWRCRMRC